MPWANALNAEVYALFAVVAAVHVICMHAVDHIVYLMCARGFLLLLSSTVHIAIVRSLLIRFRFEFDFICVISASTSAPAAAANPKK